MDGIPQTPLICINLLFSYFPFFICVHVAGGGNQVIRAVIFSDAT